MVIMVGTNKPLIKLFQMVMDDLGILLNGNPKPYKPLRPS
jgi:hypothetical protein